MLEELCPTTMEDMLQKQKLLGSKLFGTAVLGGTSLFTIVGGEKGKPVLYRQKSLQV